MQHVGEAHPCDFLSCSNEVTNLKPLPQLSDLAISNHKVTVINHHSKGAIVELVDIENGAIGHGVYRIAWVFYEIVSGMLAAVGSGGTELST